MEDDNYTAYLWSNRDTLRKGENYVIRTIINTPNVIKMEINFASIPKTKYNDVTIQEED